MSSKIIMGQDAICPDGLGCVRNWEVNVQGDITQIQVDTRVNNRSCWWDAVNVTLLPIEGSATQTSEAKTLDFAIPLGVKAQSRTLLLTGIINSRSQNLYGCNRYYIQPPVGEDNKVLDGYWVDEGDVLILAPCHEPDARNAGGPPSKIK